ncbi:MAG: mechanosensitive ion channel family protein, partial [Desulfuromonadaceae bacterium]|nr:mechanosensitive ion channel family protein [Desulfuromonadaceae bacterium]
IILFMLGGLAIAAPPSVQVTETSSSVDETHIAQRVEVQAASSDQEINRRLNDILQATGWFPDIRVQVEEGIVLLDGQSESVEHRAWAGELAGNTSDVVAVVNRIKIVERSPWDFSPAVTELKNLWRKSLQQLPRLGFALFLLVLVLVIGKLFANGIRRVLALRLNPLLRDMVARILSIALLLVGFYLVLQVAGLSGLAATILGGTGIAGLVAGIAFRDILENYLASLLISIRNPFHLGDLVEIADHTGIVLRVTTRGTVLMNLDGNHVQIPNSTVYKSIIRNFSANPNRRDFFEIGIGFENEPSFAQEVALDVLNNHPAVLKDPESLVLVDRLGAATVILLVFFWYDGSAYNVLKVKSALIRSVKKAFEIKNISMPDEAREVLFPDGISVQMVDTTSRSVTIREKKSPPPETVTNDAEGDLASEERQLREQAKTSRIPEEGSSILKEKT